MPTAQEIMQDIADIMRNIKRVRGNLSVDELDAMCHAYNDAMRIAYPHVMQEGQSKWLSRMWRWKGDTHRWVAERDPNGPLGAGHNREARDAYRAALFHLGLSLNCIQSIIFTPSFSEESEDDIGLTR